MQNFKVQKSTVPERERDDVGPYEDTDYELKEDEIHVYSEIGVETFTGLLPNKLESLLSNNKMCNYC